MNNRQLTKEDKQLKEKIYKHLSYTSQDYESILGDIISLFRSQDLDTEWDNLSEADPIFILMHLLAAHKDILNYMLDYRVLETYALTARERASLIRLARSVGYKIPGLVPSYANYATNIYLDTALTIKTGQTFSNENETWTYLGEDKILNPEQPTLEWERTEETLIGLIEDFEWYEEPDNVSPTQAGCGFGFRELEHIPVTNYAVGDVIRGNLNTQVFEPCQTWAYFKLVAIPQPTRERIGLVQGTPSLVEFTGKDINTNNNSFTLAGNNIASYRNTPYRTSYLSTSDDAGWEWEEVDSLVGHSINDNPKPYIIDKDTAGLYYIKFPNDMTLYTEYDDVRFSLIYVSTDGDKVVKAPSTLSAVIADQKVTLEHKHNNYLFIQGLPEATADEVREGYKNYRGTLQSLSTLEDYKQFMLTKQTVVPNVDKVMVIDTQASTNPDIQDIETLDIFPLGHIGIYFTLDTHGTAAANEYLNPATQADQEVLDNLLNEFERYRQAGVKIGLNKETDNNDEYIAPLTPLPIKVFFTSTDNNKANQGIMQLIREYIGNKDIGSQLTVRELERLILTSEYNDYFINKHLDVILVVRDNAEDKTDTAFNEFLKAVQVDTEEYYNDNENI